MKPIDYAAIIEKANIRKEALQAFEAQFASIREQEQNLIMALTYFATLGDAVVKIDPEGQALLGPVGSKCRLLASTARAAEKAIYAPDYYTNEGLRALIAGLE